MHELPRAHDGGFSWDEAGAGEDLREHVRHTTSKCNCPRAGPLLPVERLRGAGAPGTSPFQAGKPALVIGDTAPGGQKLCRQEAGAATSASPQSDTLSLGSPLHPLCPTAGPILLSKKFVSQKTFFLSNDQKKKNFFFQETGHRLL